MKKTKKNVEIVQDVDKSISVMRNSSKWMKKSEKTVSKWWDLKNLNSKFLLKYAKPGEFYVVLADNKPAAAAILQLSQNAQDWKSVGKGKSKSALYIHWLCVSREFARMGMPKIIIDFAKQHAKQNNVKLLRVDTNAEEMKLRKIYEDLGFKLVSIEQEGYRRTAFYEEKIA